MLGYVVAGESVAGLPPGSGGYIWLPGLTVLAAFSITTAPLGARAAHALPVSTFKRVFACVLYALAGYMLWKDLTACAVYPYATSSAACLPPQERVARRRRTPTPCAAVFVDLPIFGKMP